MLRCLEQKIIIDILHRHFEFHTQGNARSRIVYCADGVLRGGGEKIVPES